MREREPDMIAAAVVDLVIAEHPAQLSVEELVRAIADDISDFGDRDAVAVAIRELVAAGLVHRSRDFIFATRPAVLAHRFLGL